MLCFIWNIRQINWTMSRAYCESYEMQLVSVETEEEDQAITNLWLMSSSSKFESG